MQTGKSAQDIARLLVKNFRTKCEQQTKIERSKQVWQVYNRNINTNTGNKNKIQWPWKVCKQKSHLISVSRTSRVPLPGHTRKHQLKYCIKGFFLEQVLEVCACLTTSVCLCVYNKIRINITWADWIAERLEKKIKEESSTRQWEALSKAHMAITKF